MSSSLSLQLCMSVCVCISLSSPHLLSDSSKVRQGDRGISKSTQQLQNLTWNEVSWKDKVLFGGGLFFFLCLPRGCETQNCLVANRRQRKNATTHSEYTGREMEEREYVYVITRG